MVGTWLEAEATSEHCTEVDASASAPSGEAVHREVSKQLYTHY